VFVGGVVGATCFFSFPFPPTLLRLTPTSLCWRSMCDRPSEVCLCVRVWDTLLFPAAVRRRDRAAYVAHTATPKTETVRYYFLSC